MGEIQLNKNEKALCIVSFIWPFGERNSPMGSPLCRSRSQAKFLHYVRTAHAKAEILTQEYLSPV